MSARKRMNLKWEEIGLVLVGLALIATVLVSSNNSNASAETQSAPAAPVLAEDLIEDQANDPTLDMIEEILAENPQLRKTNEFLLHDAEPEPIAVIEQKSDSTTPTKTTIPEPSTAPASLAERQKKVELGMGASLGGIRPFPADNYWNQKVSHLPVDPRSERIINRIGAFRNAHPDFGSGMWDGSPIGIPYVVVSAKQPPANVVFTAYGEESDAGPYPVPQGAPIELYNDPDADRHVIILNRDTWSLHELYRVFPVLNGTAWEAESGAIFDLSRNHFRPKGWTSADAAGLPIFPGLARYDEVAAGAIHHALRFTVSTTRRAYTFPASHWASQHTHPDLPPMGMRVRLKANYPTDHFPAQAKVILECLKTYGMILADNGSDWYISGSPDERWDNDQLRTLKSLRGGDFEVVQMGEIVAD